MLRVPVIVLLSVDSSGLELIVGDIFCVLT